MMRMEQNHQPQHRKFQTVLICLAGLLFGCMCLAPTGEIVSLGLPQRTSTQVIDQGVAGGWYLKSGAGAVAFGPYMDSYWLPDVRTREGIGELDYTHHMSRWTFSPDGSYLAAFSTPWPLDEEPEDYIAPHFIIFDSDMNVVFQDEDVVSSKGQVVSPLDWSSDSQTIAFAAINEVWLFHLAIQKYERVATNHKMLEHDRFWTSGPRWSADGASLTYQTENDEIAVLTIETGEIEIIAEGRLPSWSPDGKSIAYFTVDNNRWYARLYDVETETSRLLDQISGFRRPLIWSPDSRYLFYKGSWTNSIYGPLKFYDVVENEGGSTGLGVAVIDGPLQVLPDWYKNLIYLRDNNETENPNRR